jgi:hypothetical protein
MVYQFPAPFFYQKDNTLFRTGFAQKVLDRRNIVLGAKLLLALNLVSWLYRTVVVPGLVNIQKAIENEA